MGSNTYTVTDATYDSTGRQLTSKQTTIQRDAQDQKTGSSISDSINTYDNSGHQLTSTQTNTQFDAQDQKTGSSIYEFTNTFDSIGHQLTSKQTNTQFNAAGKPTNSNFWISDATGHNIGGGETYYDNGLKASSSIYTITSAVYGIKGRVLSSTQNTTWLDVDDKPTGSEISENIFTYDDTYGNPLTNQRTITNFDATGNKVKSFGYSENGNTIYSATAPFSDNKFVGYANIKETLIIDTIDATKADFNFNVYEGQNSYTFNITGFNTGDKLIFNNTPTITNADTADGIIDVVSNTTTIHLTGLVPEQDSAINGFLSFNDVFGNGSIGTTG
jgi:hypothetical protein